MPIQFFCPGCGKRMQTPDQTAGRKGKCPHCGIKVVIPDQSLAMPLGEEGTASSRSSPTPMRWKTKSASDDCQPTAATAEVPGSRQGDGCDIVTFACPQCQRRVKVSAAARGKLGLCPQCHAKIVIPTA